MKEELNDKKVLYVFFIGLLLTILIFIGSSFAWFSYSKDGVKIATMTISNAVKLHYQEGTNQINISNGLPMSDTHGKVQNDFFEFEITGETSTFDVEYIVSARVSTLDENKIPLNYISIYLTEVTDTTTNPVTESEVLFTTYDQLSKISKNNNIEEKIYNRTIPRNTSNYSKTYRLRIWINEDADYSPTEENGVQTYPMQGKSLALTINVYTEAEDYEATPPTPVLLLRIPDPVTPPGLYTMDDVLVEDWDSLVNNRGMELNLANGKQIVSDSLDENNIDYGKLIIGDTATTIASSSFDSDTRLKSITIPRNISTIGQYAFRNSALEEAFILSHDIGNYAFYQSNNLKEIKIKEVNDIGYLAFYGCNSLDELKIDSLYGSIGNYAFQSNSLKNVTIYNGNVTLNNGAFANAPVETLTVYGDNNIIYSGIFYNKTALKEIELHNVTLPHSDTFRGFDNLETIRLYNVIPSGSTAFGYNSNLKNVYIDGGYIGDYEFASDTAIETMEVHNITDIKSFAFYHASGLESFTVPNGVDEIGNSSFSYCTSLENIDLGQVETIGSNAFSSSDSLTSITIPATVTTIGNSAFSSTSLSEVYFEDKQGWKTSLNSENVDISVSDLNNAATAATYLKTTYTSEWTKE